MSASSKQTTDALHLLLGLANVCLGQFVVGAQMRAAIVVLPALAEFFDVPIDVAQWLSLAYQVALVGLLLPSGKAGDIVGRRRLFVLGLLVFLAGSILSGLASSIWQLLAFRALSGVGAAAVIANGRTILVLMFPPSARGRAIALSSTAYAVGYAAGSFFAGTFYERYGWRSLFLSAIPFALIGLMTARYLPTGTTDRRDARVDYGGAVLFILASLTFLFGLQLLMRHESSWKVLTCLVATAALSIVFVALERRVKEPLFELGLVQELRIVASLLALVCVAFVRDATLFLLPFYLQHVHGYPITAIGHLIFVHQIAGTFASPVSGFMSERVGTRPVVVIAVLLALLGLVGIGFGSSGGVALIAYLVMIGFGVGLFLTANALAILARAPVERMGTVNGLAMTVMLAAGPIGTSVATLSLSRALAHQGLGADHQHWPIGSLAVAGAFVQTWVVVAAAGVLALLFSLKRQAPSARS